MARVPVNNHGSFVALGLAVATMALVAAGFFVSKEMTKSAQSVGSSTRPVDPGSIQDHSPVGNKDKQQPLQNTTSHLRTRSTDSAATKATLTSVGFVHARFPWHRLRYFPTSSGRPYAIC